MNYQMIPFTDHNVCGVTGEKSHRHMEPDVNGWVYCDFKFYRFRAWDPTYGFESEVCYIPSHNHPEHNGFKFCAEDGKHVYWATDPQTRCEQNARSHALVTGSTGAVYLESRPIMNGPVHLGDERIARAEYIRPEHVHADKD